MTATALVRSSRPEPRPRPQPRRQAPRASRPAAARQAAAARPATPQARPAATIAPAVYRRRRLALLAVLLVVVLSAGLLATRVGQADAGLDGPPPAAPVYVVKPGDTLWTIADTVAPGVDRREAVGQLSDAAGGTELVPGQRIELPRGLR